MLILEPLRMGTLLEITLLIGYLLALLGYFILICFGSDYLVISSDERILFLF